MHDDVACSVVALISTADNFRMFGECTLAHDANIVLQAARVRKPLPVTEDANWSVVHYVAPWANRAVAVWEIKRKWCIELRRRDVGHGFKLITHHDVVFVC